MQSKIPRLSTSNANTPDNKIPRMDDTPTHQLKGPDPRKSRTSWFQTTTNRESDPIESLIGDRTQQKSMTIKTKNKGSKKDDDDLQTKARRSAQMEKAQRVD